MEKVLGQLSKDDITLHELVGESYHSFGLVDRRGGRPNPH